MYSYLTDLDIEKINAYRKFVLDGAKGEPADLQYVLRYWESAKQTLFKMLGNQLIVEKEIQINMPTHTLEKTIADALNDMNSKYKLYQFYQDMRRRASEFVERANWFDIMTLFNEDMLAQNKYTGSTFTVKYKDKKVTVQNGCKPVKMLGKLALDLFNMYEDKEHNPYEDFRLGQSLITNERTLKGTLCLSVHPLDYMTMSDNTTWESCMSWRKNGCYRRGTVEMMNSKYVVVAYLKASQDMELIPGDDYYKWNDKKWRILMVVDKDFMTNIKGYPYQSNELSTIALQWLRELAHKNLGWSYKPDVIEYDYDDGVIIDGHKFDLELLTDTMYNDCGRCSQMLMIADKKWEDDPFLRLNYSGDENCMWCGDGEFDDESEGSLLCLDCDNVIYCTNCGDRIDPDEVIWINGAPYCDYCYDECTVTDNITEETIFIDESNDIRIVPDDFDPETHNIYNYSTITTALWEIDNPTVHLTKYFKLNADNEISYFRRNEWGSKRYYIHVSDLTEDGIKLCNFWSICIPE